MEKLLAVLLVRLFVIEGFLPFLFESGLFGGGLHLVLNGFGLGVRLIDRLFVELHVAVIAVAAAGTEHEGVLFVVHFDHFADDAADGLDLAARADCVDGLIEIFLLFALRNERPYKEIRAPGAG